MPAQKKNPLAAALDGAVSTATAGDEKRAKSRTRGEKAKPRSRSAQSREGKTLIGGHFDERYAITLGLIAAEERTTKQALLGEALDLLFTKKGKRV